MNARNSKANPKVSPRAPFGILLGSALVTAGLVFGSTGCIPDAGVEGTGTGGGTSASGGAPGSGGATSSSGGAPSSSGGAPGSGGASSGGAPSSGGASGSGGATSGSGGRADGTGGRANTGGTSGGSGGKTQTGGTSGGTGGTSGGTGGASATGGAGGATTLTNFSFFVTSVGAMKKLSNNALGFGGDLRYGETGDGAGLRGADKICAAIADTSMPGASAKGWRAFLSAPAAGSMAQVNAIDRIGNGPWFDRMGRRFSASKANLIGFRPSDADAAVKNDFPNEYGLPNHSDGMPGCTGNSCPDNHDTMTGTNAMGQLYVNAKNPNPTCDGWTNKTGKAGLPHVGHAWPRMPVASNTCSPGGIGGGGDLTIEGCYGHWMSSLDEAGCAPGINLVEMGPPNPNDPTVGSGGGYGGIFCFALMP